MSVKSGMINCNHYWDYFDRVYSISHIPIPLQSYHFFFRLEKIMIYHYWQYFILNNFFFLLLAYTKIFSQYLCFILQSFTVFINNIDNIYNYIQNEVCTFKKFNLINFYTIIILWPSMLVIIIFYFCIFIYLIYIYLLILLLF